MATSRVSEPSPIVLTQDEVAGYLERNAWKGGEILLAAVMQPDRRLDQRFARVYNTMYELPRAGVRRLVNSIAVDYRDVRTVDGQALIEMPEEGSPVVLMASRITERDGRPVEEDWSFLWLPTSGWLRASELEAWVAGVRQADLLGDDGGLDDDPRFHDALRMVIPGHTKK